MLKDDRQNISLGFAALISSIETLIDFDHKGDKEKYCKDCGQQIFGVNKKLMKFMKQHVSTNIKLKKHIK